MRKKSVLIVASVLFILAGCERAKEFRYYVKNSTNNNLTVFVDYSISARGNRKSDTLNILPDDKQLIYTHSGLGGFYTGVIETIRFSGRDTLKQEWRNRSQADISKHFFRRNSWKLTHRDDDEERYQFVVMPGDLKGDK